MSRKRKNQRSRYNATRGVSAERSNSTSGTTIIATKADLCHTGLHRTRLSCAISKDEGENSGNFKNLESLDDLTVAPPDDLVEVMEKWKDSGYHQPRNAKRYLRAPGTLRICYPNVVFCDEEEIVVCGTGMSVLGEDVLGIKIHTIPLGWFTS